MQKEPAFLNLWWGPTLGYFLGAEHKSKPDADRGKIAVKETIEQPSVFICCLQVEKEPAQVSIWY